MLGYEKNFKTGTLSLLLNHPARFRSIHARHGDIQHYDIGVQAFDVIQSLEPIRRFTHYFPAGPTLQQSSQPLPHDGMIIHQQYANCHKILRGSLRQPGRIIHKVSGWLLSRGPSPPVGFLARTRRERSSLLITQETSMVVAASR